MNGFIDDFDLPLEDFQAMADIDINASNPNLINELTFSQDNPMPDDGGFNNAFCYSYEIPQNEYPFVILLENTIPTICSVNCLFTNRLLAQYSVETSFLNIIKATYPISSVLAGRRFNMIVHEDTVNDYGYIVQPNQNANVTAYSNGPYLFGSRVHVEIGSVFPGSAFLPMFDLITNTYVDDKVLRSSGIRIHPSTNFTCRRIATNLYNKYLLEREHHDVRDDSKYNFIIGDKHVPNIGIRYTFHLIKPLVWFPLNDANQVVWKHTPELANTLVDDDPYYYIFGNTQVGMENVVVTNNNNLDQINSSKPNWRPNACFVMNQINTHVNEISNMMNVTYHIGNEVIVPTQAVELEKPRTKRKYERKAKPKGTSIGDVCGDCNVDNSKVKVYRKQGEVDYFKLSNACIAVPETEEKICFPMAFLRSEVRCYVREQQEGGTYKPKFVSLNTDERYIINVIGTEIPFEFRDKKYDFFNSETNEIILFNSVKKYTISNGHGRIYTNEAEEIDVFELECWKWCAKLVHVYVETVLKTEIDVNNLEEIMDAYATVFSTNISCFSLVMGGERIHTKFLQYKSLPEKEKCLSMLIHGLHAHAISSVRKFHLNFFNGRRVSEHSYCDFCCKFDRHWTQKSLFKHQSQCYDDHQFEVNHIDKLEKSQLGAFYGKQQFSYLGVNSCHRDVCFECSELEGVCRCVNPVIKNMYVVQCNTCYNVVSANKLNKHVCYMKSRKHADKIPEDKLWVFDVESCQDYHVNSKQYIHQCILVILRAVYSDETYSFKTIEEFITFILGNEKFRGTTLLAHNGGGYDHIMVQKFLECNSIEHTTIPRPNTLHKCLELTIVCDEKEDNIRFVDFMMYMTNSLKNIAKAFKLPTLKGDFPHNFSVSTNTEYIGRLPALDDPKDYYGFNNIQSESELKEAKKYWLDQEKIYCTCNEACNCNKKKWDFQKELYDYCLIDVKVLAGAVKAYRDEAINFNGVSDFGWECHGIEPFQYITQSQIALSMFLEGKDTNEMIISKERVRFDFNPKAIYWLEKIMEQNPNYKIIHSGNSYRPYYLLRFDDYIHGYCPVTNTCFYFIDCSLCACGECFQHEILNGYIHPLFKIPYSKVGYNAIEKLNKLSKVTSNQKMKLVFVYEHNVEVIDQHLFESCKLMSTRESFYGGRTEVFAAYANTDNLPDQEIVHYDVCSLYPYVCSMKELPVGLPDIYFYNNIDYARLHPNHPNRFFGYVRCHVIPNKNDFIGILPSRSLVGDAKSLKLVYDLHDKIGCWHTEMIYLAMEHGYIVDKIYEVWDWPPEKRSTTLMKGYMEFFLRMKQEAEGWDKLKETILDDVDEKDLTEADKEFICEEIKKRNGGFAKPRADKVEKNPVKRQLAKIFLNCLWGKLCQKPPKEHEIFVCGYKQYLQIMQNTLIDQETVKFRHVKDLIFKARFKMMIDQPDSSRMLNVHVAASVTAHAQVYLMRFMFRVGPERCIYCDTDSLVFLKKILEIGYASTGLGAWTDEHPGQFIRRFLAIAPKSYMEEIIENEDINYYLKCKGIRNTENNRMIVTINNLEKLIDAKVFPKESSITDLVCDSFTIHPNSVNPFVPYGILLTSYGKKNVSIVFTKRELMLNYDMKNKKGETIKELNKIGLLRLFPFGYEGNLTHEI